MKWLVSLILIACSITSNTLSEEIRPGVFRTLDERFENLKDYPFAPHYLKVDSQLGKLRMHYVDVGPRDGDPILLMHGEPSWSYLFRNMIPPLVAAGHRVIAPDLIGFGKSDKPAKRTDHSYQNHVDWIRQFVSELDLKNITLFCQDWGSLIGLRIVAGAPDRFARVVAGNAALPAGRGDDGVVIGGQWTQPDPNAKLRFEEGFMGWLKYSQTVPEFDCGIVLQAATVCTLTEAELDAYRAPFPDERYAAGPRVMPTLVRSQMATNRKAWNVLSKFDKPFLTTFSDGDPVTSGGERVFQKRIPGAKGQPHTTIKHAGHFLQEDASEQLATLINALIASDTEQPGVEKLDVVLLADKKDHGPAGNGLHDYPLWQKRWALLLGGEAASKEKQVNLVGPPDKDRDTRKGMPNVAVSTAWHWPSEEQFQMADVIVAFCYLEWTDQRLAQVRRYLQAGGGLVLIHSATWTKPKPSREVAEVVGVGGFRLFRHGDVRLEMVAPEHPICAGLPETITLEDDETYWPPTPIMESVTVLATSVEDKAKRGSTLRSVSKNPVVGPRASGFVTGKDGEAGDIGAYRRYSRTQSSRKTSRSKPDRILRHAPKAAQPMFWCYELGEGRVFGCVPGHSAKTFDDPVFRKLLFRGIAWTAHENPLPFDDVFSKTGK
jgi:haloalkane dehalogenase